MGPQLLQSPQIPCTRCERRLGGFRFPWLGTWTRRAVVAQTGTSPQARGMPIMPVQRLSIFWAADGSGHAGPRSNLARSRAAPLHALLGWDLVGPLGGYLPDLAGGTPCLAGADPRGMSSGWANRAHPGRSSAQAPSRSDRDQRALHPSLLSPLLFSHLVCLSFLRSSICEECRLWTFQCPLCIDSLAQTSAVVLAGAIHGVPRPLCY